MKELKYIEIGNDELSEKLFENVAFLSIAEGGAMGEPGGVVFFTGDGKLYHFNTLYGNVSFEKFERVFPVITKCNFGMCGLGGEVPEGWVYVNLGAGNHLIVKKEEYSEFEKKVGGFKYPEEVYCAWIPNALKVLNEKNSGNMHVSKEDRIEVFQDTQNWIKENSDLAESVIKAKKKTDVFYEDDYPIFDSTKEKEESITVTKERSYQAAMRLARIKPDSRIAVLNFANAFLAGGGVTNGARAQEECLCRCSTLYPLLYRRTLRDSFYRHHHDLNTTRASDSLIYTEGVIICKTDEDLPKRMDTEDWAKVDVITMSAPDLRDKTNSYSHHRKSGTSMNDAELYGYHVKRAIHMLTVAANKGADILVLGAFGCGAFKNNPKVVAEAYKTALTVFPKVFDEVVFAVYCSQKDTYNYKSFHDVLVSKNEK